MAPVASKLIEEVTAHAQSDSLADAREICADGTYYPNILRNNNIFFGRHQRQGVKVLQRFRGLTPSLSSGCAGDLVKSKLGLVLPSHQLHTEDGDRISSRNVDKP